MPNNLNNSRRKYFCYLGKLYFFRHTFFEFDKMQIPLNGYDEEYDLFRLFGDNRSLRFCAVTSVAALFYFERTLK